MQISKKFFFHVVSIVCLLETSFYLTGSLRYRTPHHHHPPSAATHLQTTGANPSSSSAVEIDSGPVRPVPPSSSSSSSCPSHRSSHRRSVVAGASVEKSSSEEVVDVFHAMPFAGVSGGGGGGGTVLAVRVPLFPLSPGLLPSGHRRPTYPHDAKSPLRPYQPSSSSSSHNTNTNTGVSSTTPSLPWVTSTTPAQSVLAVPPNVSRISIDVGTFIHSPTSRSWLARDPNTFVLAIEANPFSASLIGRFARPLFLQHVKEYWPEPFVTGARAAVAPAAVGSNDSTGQSPPAQSQASPIAFSDDGAEGGGDNSTNNNHNSLPSTTTPSSFSTSPSQSYCAAEDVPLVLHHSWAHIHAHSDHVVMLPTAAGVTRGAVSFQLGFPGRPDGGSMLAFRKSYALNKGKPSRVVAGVLPLADLLQYVPAAHPDGRPILWDTLKIDAQGMDVAVLFGASSYVRQFACVVGEFDIRGYSGAMRVNHVTYLASQGFAKVTAMVFANRRMFSSFAMGAVMCSASDVQLSNGRILKALRKADAKMGPWLVQYDDALDRDDREKQVAA